MAQQGRRKKSSKPSSRTVQLRWLASMFGGYDGARVVHFLALIGLLLFLVAHVVMVLIHFRKFPEMVTGGAPESEEEEE